MFQYRLTASVLFLFVYGCMIGQSNFDRLYPLQNDRSQIVLDIEQNENGEAFVLSYVASEVDNNLAVADSVVNMSHFDDKGDLKWSMDYSLLDTAAQNIMIMNSGAISLREEGMLFHAFVSFQDTVNNEGKYYCLLYEIDNSGNQLNSEVINYAAEANSSLLSNAFTKVTEEHYLFGTQLSGDTIDGMSFSDSEIEALWAYSYAWTQENMDNENYELTLSSIKNTPDSALLMGVNTDIVAVSDRMLLTRLDTLGNILWSQQVFASALNEVDLDLVGANQINDTTILLVANITQDDNSMVLAASVDTRHTVNWSKYLNLGDSLSYTRAEEMDVSASGDIIATLAYGQNADDATVNLGVNISSTGDINWLNTYDPNVDQVIYGPDRNGYLVVGNESIMLGNTIYKEVETDSLQAMPRIIKLNTDGQSSCEMPLETATMVDFALTADTTTWQLAFQTPNVTTINTLVRNADEYDLPILSLRDTMYCPDDPVMFELDATVPGAVSYLWSTGDTTATIIATELMVDYTVQVRVEDEYCFTLCDTTQLTEVPEIEAQMLLNTARWCDERILLLGVQASGQVESITWSTGETNVGQIELTAEAVDQTYSVTLVDICDRDTTLSFSINESNLPTPDGISIASDVSMVCEEGTIVLTAQSADGRNLDNLIWTHSGETTNSVSIDQTGTYGVTATDYCDYEISGQITIGEGEFPSPDEITISSEKQSDCNQVGFLLEAVNDRGISNIVWTPDGQTTESILAITPGSYTVSGIDECRLPVSAEITLEAQDFALEITQCAVGIGSGCICYPTGFTPGSDNEVDRFFNNTGITNCPCEPVDYSLKIYNRWNQLVYETSDIDDHWDGITSDGDRSPSAQYFFVVSYRMGSTVVNDKGSFALIRDKD